MYEIVENKRFLDELKKLSGSIRRGDEFTDGVKWRLAHDPKSGCQISENIWFVKTRFDRIQGRIIVFYTFDNQKVYVLSILNSTTTL